VDRTTCPSLGVRDENIAQPASGQSPARCLATENRTVHQTTNSFFPTTYGFLRLTFPEVL